MPSPTKLGTLLAFSFFLGTAGPSAELFPAAPPGVDRSDALARASGNRKAVAVTIGRALFSNQWPAQILNVYADGARRFVVAGLRISGVHFHRALSRAAFLDEVRAIVARAFRASPPVREVDVWVSVPLSVGTGIVVSGDLAKPTSRTVFTVSVLRGEGSTAFDRRLRSGRGVFWDQEWKRDALK